MLEQIYYLQSEFVQANLAQIYGEMYADVYFVGTPDQTANEASRLIGLTKTLEPVGGKFETGGLVRVTLTPDLSAFDLAVGSSQLVYSDRYAI